MHTALVADRPIRPTAATLSHLSALDISRSSAPRWRPRSAEALLLCFAAAVLVLVASVAGVAAGGDVGALIATLALVLVLAGGIAATVFELVSDEDGESPR